MAHPENQEASTPANTGDAVEDFADFLDASGIEDEEEEAPEDGEALEGDEPEGEDSPEEDGEPEDPAIDPPVSWGTDAKELFAQLPADLQKQVVEREAQREKFVQAKALEATEAKRSARIEAETAFAERQRQYASEVDFFASQFVPQAPDPSLASTDPVTFIQLNAQYQAALVQHQNLMQRAEQARSEAAYREQVAAAEQQEAELAVLAQQIPDWSDEAKRAELLTSVASIGAELGYSPEALRDVSAQDILALRKAVEWKSKAAKYDALQKSKMEKVRTAKALPKVVRPGVAPTRGEISSNKSQAAWQNVKAARTKDAQANAFADYLETSGHL